MLIIEAKGRHINLMCCVSFSPPSRKLPGTQFGRRSSAPNQKINSQRHAYLILSQGRSRDCQCEKREGRSQCSQPQFEFKFKWKVKDELEEMELVYPETAQQRHSGNFYSLVFFLLDSLTNFQLFQYTTTGQDMSGLHSIPIRIFLLRFIWTYDFIFGFFRLSLPVSLSLCFLFDRSHCGRAVCRLRHCHMPVAQTGHTSLLCHAQLCPRPERYVKRPRKISFLAPANRAICVRARTLPL